MAEAPIATPFPAGDPRNTLYGETITGLRHQYETTLSNLNFEETQEHENNQYKQTQITKAEPGAFRGQEGKFNRGGLLTSGVYARERGGLESQFAAKHGAITLGEHQRGEKRTRAREAAKEGLEKGEAGATTKAEVNAYLGLEKNPPQTPPSPYPIPPAQQAAIERGVPAGPGGVVPYEGGKVRVGMPARASYTPGSLRRAAARKVVKRG